MRTALATYKLHNGDFPSTGEGLAALFTPPTSATNWRGPYLDEPGNVMSRDPWKHPYQFAYPGTHSSSPPQVSVASTGSASATAPETAPHYDLWSMGPDGISGTADDIGNWQPYYR